jgi:hypothetical protein
MKKTSPFTSEAAADHSKQAAEFITDKRGFAARWKFSTRTIDNFLAAGMPAVFVGKRRVRIETAVADGWVREKFAARRLGPSVK